MMMWMKWITTMVLMEWFTMCGSLDDFAKLVRTAELAQTLKHYIS